MKLFKNIDSGEYYFEGKDQRRQLNLINAKSGSEYFIPGYYVEETEKVEKYFILVELREVLEAIPDPYFPIPKDYDPFYKELAHKNKKQREEMEQFKFNRMVRQRRENQRRRNGF